MHNLNEIFANCVCMELAVSGNVYCCVLNVYERPFFTLQAIGTRVPIEYRRSV